MRLFYDTCQPRKEGSEFCSTSNPQTWQKLVAGPSINIESYSYSSLHTDILCLNVSEQKERAELIEMDPNLLLLIMMIIVLYFFTKICLVVITAGQQRVLAVQAPALIDIRRQGAIQRLEDMTFQGATQVEDQTINRRANNRVRPQPQEHDE